MSKKMKVKAMIVVVLFVSAMFLVSALSVLAEPSASLISGRLAAKYDSKSDTVTAMIAGYCEGQPVTIGPSSWAVSEKDFANITAEEVGKNLCGDGMVLKKVTKSVNNGQEIVADVVIVRP